jgi:hypothetical protein
MALHTNSLLHRTADELFSIDRACFGEEDRDFAVERSWMKECRSEVSGLMNPMGSGSKSLRSSCELEMGIEQEEVE